MANSRLPQRVYFRRRVLAGLVAVAGVWLLVSVAGAILDSGGSASDVVAEAAGSAEPAPITEPPAPTTTTTAPIPASQRELVHLDTIGGTIAPKSVVASGEGLFVAQNMMYQHTITVYDRNFELVKTISDEIEPAAWGLDYAPGTLLRGAPVEASFSPDGKKAYVSNYHMYGGDYGPEPSDSCPDMDRDPSFVYRIDMESLEIDEVIQVGTVPKFLAVSPDGSRVVVSNWCSYDVSIVDTAAGSEIERIDVGRYPRGIVFDPSGDTAYVTLMGGDQIVEIDMRSNSVSGRFGLAGSPRHLTISPDGAFLYVTLNRAGEVAKVDISSRTVVARLATGAAPRSMDISADGEALFVVNYNSDTVSKVLTEDLVEVQELSTGANPIGVTYDTGTQQVWVANYSGSIMVFHDRPVAESAEKASEPGS